MEENNYTQQTFKSRVESSTLYEAIRPTTFDEYVGQDHLLNKQNGSIYSFIKLGYLPSMILLGPPGVGKTTLASVISYECNLPFIELSATTLTTKELKQIVLMHNQQIVVFIDEIHRLTKIQQDWLLPYVENGEIILIGATTSHPSKRIRHAILSRCHVFHLNKLAHSDLRIILKNAIHYQNLKRKHVLNLPDVVYDQACEDLILDQAHGDSRIAINLVELISNNFGDDNDCSTMLVKGDLVKILSNLSCTSTEDLIKYQDIFMNFMDVLSKGCTTVNHGGLFYDNQLEFFYENFKIQETENEYVHQMQVSDDSDVEYGDMYSECGSDDGVAIEQMNDPDDFHLVAALYYLNLLLMKGESTTVILRRLILFAVNYIDGDNALFNKLLSFKKGIDNRNDGSSETTLSNCVEWLMFQRRSINAQNVSSLFKKLKDYFNKQSIVHQTTDIDLDDVDISFDESDIAKIETYPKFRQSQESQIKGFEVTYEDNICESDMNN